MADHPPQIDDRTTASPWPIAAGAGLGVLLLVGGVIRYAVGTGVLVLTVAESEVFAGLPARGFVVAVAGAVVFLGAAIGRYWAG